MASRAVLEKTVLEVEPEGETGFYTSLASFCRDNAEDTGLCRRAKKLKKGQSLSEGGGAAPHITVTSLGVMTRDQRRQHGVEYDERAERTRHGNPVIDFGTSMASDERASYFPQRQPRYGSRQHDPLLQRLEHSRYRGGAGYYSVGAEFAKRRHAAGKKGS